MSREAAGVIAAIAVTVVVVAVVVICVPSWEAAEPAPPAELPEVRAPVRKPWLGKKNSAARALWTAASLGATFVAVHKALTPYRPERHVLLPAMAASESTLKVSIPESNAVPARMSTWRKVTSSAMVAGQYIKGDLSMERNLLAGIASAAAWAFARNDVAPKMMSAAASAVTSAANQSLPFASDLKNLLDLISIRPFDYMAIVDMVVSSDDVNGCLLMAYRMDPPPIVTVEDCFSILDAPVHPSFFVENDDNRIAMEKQLSVLRQRWPRGHHSGTCVMRSIYRSMTVNPLLIDRNLPNLRFVLKSTHLVEDDFVGANGKPVVFYAVRDAIDDWVHAELHLPAIRELVSHHLALVDDSIAAMIAREASYEDDPGRVRFLQDLLHAVLGGSAVRVSGASRRSMADLLVHGARKHDAKSELAQLKASMATRLTGAHAVVPERVSDDEIETANRLRQYASRVVGCLGLGDPEGCWGKCLPNRPTDIYLPDRDIGDIADGFQGILDVASDMRGILSDVLHADANRPMRSVLSKVIHIAGSPEINVVGLRQAVEELDLGHVILPTASQRRILHVDASGGEHGTEWIAKRRKEARLVTDKTQFHVHYLDEDNMGERYRVLGAFDLLVTSSYALADLAGPHLALKARITSAFLRLPLNAAPVVVVEAAAMAAGPILQKVFQEYATRFESALMAARARSFLTDIHPMTDDELADQLQASFPSRAIDDLLPGFNHTSPSAASIAEGHITGYRKALTEPPVRAWAKIRRHGIDQRYLVEQSLVEAIRTMEQRGVPRQSSGARALESLAQRVTMDLDFAGETDSIRLAGRVFGDMAGIEIPQVLHNDANVIVMTLAPGATLSKWVRDPTLRGADVCARNDLFVAFAHRWFDEGMFSRGPTVIHSDPHMGNLIYSYSKAMRKGTLTVVDWGQASRPSSGLAWSVGRQAVDVVFGTVFNYPDMVGRALGVDAGNLFADNASIVDRIVEVVARHGQSSAMLQMNAFVYGAMHILRTLEALEADSHPSCDPVKTSAAFMRDVFHVWSGRGLLAIPALALQHVGIAPGSAGVQRLPRWIPGVLGRTLWITEHKEVARAIGKAAVTRDASHLVPYGASLRRLGQTALTKALRKTTPIHQVDPAVANLALSFASYSVWGALMNQARRQPLTTKHVLAKAAQNAAAQALTFKAVELLQPKAAALVDAGADRLSEQNVPFVKGAYRDILNNALILSKLYLRHKLYAIRDAVEGQYYSPVA